MLTLRFSSSAQAAAGGAGYFGGGAGPVAGQDRVAGEAGQGGPRQAAADQEDHLALLL